jgi:hypothetical protein
LKIRKSITIAILSLAQLGMQMRLCDFLYNLI